MYLKSIEMQGFKSFAGKMNLEFHDGITAIVGPNGSGKSNIADAVRWVLGEQSAKELRGGNMQDVIFAGTQSRKPLGFASVCMTLDNADHSLPIEYDVVSVTRRLYRSGESEYLINGSICRLRDIQELFYDTGIGKEGYSIIGQGHMDRILNSKPEDRRELFDEAAGIVKFKRRKIATLKKLENEESNLLRVTDILTELTRQIGPLEKQSEKARVYLEKREELKKNDLELFLQNDAKAHEEMQKLESALEIASAELKQADEAYGFAREEYERIDGIISENDARIEELRTSFSESEKKVQSLWNNITILEEQIKSSDANKAVYAEQRQNLQLKLEEAIRTKEEIGLHLSELEKAQAQAVLEQEAAEKKYVEIGEQIKALSIEAENNKNELIRLLNDRSSIKGRNQRYSVLKEQLQIKKADLSSREILIYGKKESFENDYRALCEERDAVASQIEKLEEENKKRDERFAKLKTELEQAAQALDNASMEFHKQSSLLESLRNIMERYEGYGTSVKRIMEIRDKNPGIHGVVAELISVEQKYETAIETALGGSLQNIVTDNEATAKYLIEYLKRGKFGRATFLPLKSAKAMEGKYEPLDDRRVLGIASDLVKCEDQFRPLIEKLLGRTYVVTDIDAAIALERQYDQQYKVVTLEGELINRGGAMTGGSYKNNANLLGRQRQIESLSAQVKEAKKKMETAEEKIRTTKEERDALRLEQSAAAEQHQKLSLQKNTLNVQIEQAKDTEEEILIQTEKLLKEKDELTQQDLEIADNIKNAAGELSASDEKEKQLDALMREYTGRIETLRQEEDAARSALEEKKIESTNIEQQTGFAGDQQQTLSGQIASLEAELADMDSRIKTDEIKTKDKEDEIKRVRAFVEGADTYRNEASEELTKALAEKEKLTERYKDFFRQREELSEKRSLLDKECFRIQTMLEKQEADQEKRLNYLYEEYELRPSQIPPVEEQHSKAELQASITRLKGEIKALGSVNINAIDEYKEIKKRHEFLSTQHADIVKAAESLKGIIGELDAGMRKQFKKEFVFIQAEFDKVFRRLFGGGSGSLELIEGEDVLDAGVRIIAQPPGKKLQNMMQLSGGEKTLTAIALLFAIQNLKPSPFCLLDEIEAALDDENAVRFADYLKNLSRNIQFIMITHRKGTMSAADRLYGITMQEKGVSTMVSVDLIESQLD